MELNVFTNDKEKADAKASLAALMDHPGWKYLLRVYDQNISVLDTELHTKDDFKTLDEVYRLQDRIADFEQHKILPQLLIEEATTTAADEELDIYQ